jgi:hypothetical protein
VVAIKTSKQAHGEGAEEMIKEAAVMAQVSGHRNLVSLIGVVTRGEPLLLLVSHCQNGSLLSLLKKRVSSCPGVLPLSFVVHVPVVRRSPSVFSKVHCQCALH